MALPDSFLMTSGNPIIFANTTYNPTAVNNLGTRTNQINLTSLANNAARQSDKIDLGQYRSPIYSVISNLDFLTPPQTGVVEFWWGPSVSSVSGECNPGKLTGVDSAYTGYGTTQTHLDNSIKQLQYIGDFPCYPQASPSGQTAYVGELIPTHRYGSLVVYNKSGAAMASGVAQVAQIGVALYANYGVVVE